MIKHMGLVSPGIALGACTDHSGMIPGVTDCEFHNIAGTHLSAIDETWLIHQTAVPLLRNSYKRIGQRETS